MSVGAEPVTVGRREQTIPLETARWRLAALWFSGFGFIFFIMVAQSLGGAYGNEVQRAWSWALPNFLPTLALMISVFAADALRPMSDTAPVVRRSFAMLALGLSAFYIAVTFIPLLAQPLVDGADPVTARLALLDTSNLWLAPLQSVVVAAIGVLFFLKEGTSAEKKVEG